MEFTRTMTQAGKSSADAWLVAEQDIEACLPIVINLMTEYPHELPYYYDMQALVQLISDKTFDLWVGVDNGEIQIAALLSLDCYPLRREYRYVWLGGKNIRKYIPHATTKIEKYAYLVGAEAVVIEGRPAWAKLLTPHDYVSPKILLRKSLIRSLGH